jgi:hypothetical protein
MGIQAGKAGGGKSGGGPTGDPGVTSRFSRFFFDLILSRGAQLRTISTGKFRV